MDHYQHALPVSPQLPSAVSHARAGASFRQAKQRHPRFRISEAGLANAFLLAISQKSQKGKAKMKLISHVPLRFIHSSSANFTLRIKKKPVQPHLFPFSSKKLTVKEVKYEWARSQHQ